MSHLIGDEGFRSPEDLYSLGLSIGLVLSEETPVEPEGSTPMESSSLPIWPIVQIIAHQRSPSLLTPEEMDAYAEPYLNRGLILISEEVGERKGSEAMRAIARLLHP